MEAPFLCDIQGVDTDSNFIFEQSEYPVPVLNVYSDASWEHLREWNQYEENARLLEMDSKDVQNIYLSGIGHFSLTDLSLSSPFLTRRNKIDNTKTTNESKRLIAFFAITLFWTWSCGLLAYLFRDNLSLINVFFILGGPAPSIVGFGMVMATYTNAAKRKSPI